jgi:hypothetical protein
MVDELDALTNDDDEVAEVETAEVAETVEAVAESTEQGEDKAASPVASEDDQTGHVPSAVMLSERRRRQAVEAEFADYRAQNEGNHEPPNALEDPEGAYAHLRAEMQASMREMTTNSSRSSAMRSYTDYVAREAVFMELAQDNPQLVNAMHASGDPAEFAYQTARKHAEFQDTQNVDEYRAKIHAEERAKLVAEFEGKQTQQTQRNATIDAALDVGSLATARSSSGATVNDDDLGDVVAGNS